MSFLGSAWVRSRLFAGALGPVGGRVLRSGRYHDGLRGAVGSRRACATAAGCWPARGSGLCTQGRVRSTAGGLLGRVQPMLVAPKPRTAPLARTAAICAPGRWRDPGGPPRQLASRSRSPAARQRSTPPRADRQPVWPNDGGSCFRITRRGASSIATRLVFVVVGTPPVRSHTTCDEPMAAGVSADGADQLSSRHVRAPPPARLSIEGARHARRQVPVTSSAPDRSAQACRYCSQVPG